jgi:hypothetical protein
MSDHVWAQENIAAYVAGGLDPVESERLEKHAADCASCAQAIDDARALDRRLAPLFAAANPGPALEDRIIQSLPEKPVRARTLVFSRRMKIMLGAAAAVMLAVIGAGVSALMEQERIGFPMAATPGFKKGVNLVGGTIQPYEVDERGQLGSGGGRRRSSGGNPRGPMQDSRIANNSGRGYPVAGLPPGQSLGTDWGVKGQAEAKSTDGLKDLADGTSNTIKSADDLAKEVREQTLSVLRNGEAEAKGIARKLGREVDGLELSKRRPAEANTPMAPDQSIPPTSGGEVPQIAAGRIPPPATPPASSASAGKGKDSKDMPVAMPPGGLPAGDFPAGAGVPGGGSYRGLAIPPSGMAPPAGKQGGPVMTGSGGGSGRGGFGGGYGPGAGTPYGGNGNFPGPANAYNPSTAFLATTPVNQPPGAKEVADQGKAIELMFKYTDDRKLPALNRQYFNPSSSLASQTSTQQEAALKDAKKLMDELQKNMKSGAMAKAEYDREVAQLSVKVGEKKAADSPKGEVKKGNVQGSTQPEPAQPPPSVRRIIIRTGEIEFEIESFDDSVATVMRLITASKGGFIATINSDKLPNGKVKGSIVVRMPPEKLDQFLLDLRKELSKTGELKNQRLGSQDVTKQYTDLQSRLRAARTMEERLLKIIKDGKGAIKDLLQAEKELGIWRTKIEEMEGEIRYYNNMADYATLTINLHEKNIRLAAVLTENERVQAGIEVEDVEKAHQAALKLILDAKGRVTRSELKQHTAGQFNAILNFEVAPDAAGPMRDRLKQLGNMVRLQIDRIQGTENGGVAPKDGKIKRGDTQFLISIYNLANVAPRETVVLRLAVAGVPVVYQKLREAVAKAKGHVVNANLDEKDKLNINAQLDFDVRRLGEGEILTALAAAGETLSKQVSRVPEGDNVTDSKMLFRITLIDADSIQPRETLTMRIAATDVPAAYKKLREALAKVKSRVINAQINEQDRRNISAVLDFVIRRADEGTLQTLLSAAGETLTRHVTRLPESPNVTDARVLAKVELVDLDAVQPRETILVKIAAMDVPAAYRKLREAIGKIKSRVINTQINEQDRRNITAQLDFTVGRSDEGTLEELLAGAGETLTRQVSRLPESATVTDSKVLAKVELIDSESLPPRETVILKIAAVDVPAAYQKLRDTVAKAKGRVAAAQLNEQDRRNVTATLNFDVTRKEESVVQTTLSEAGEALTRQVSRQQENISVTDTRVAFKVEMMAAAAIQPRETTTLALEVTDVSNALSVFNAEVKEAQGRTVETTVGQDRNGQVSAKVIYDVPLSIAAVLAERFKTAGHVRVHQVTRDPQAPEGKLALGRIVVTVSTADVLVPSDQGLWPEIRRGLAFSLRGLSMSASWLIVGLLFVLPWLLLIYVVVWLVRRIIGSGTGATAGGSPSTAPAAPAG